MEADLQNSIEYIRKSIRTTHEKIETIEQNILDNERITASLWADVVGYEGSDEPLDKDFISFTEHELKERWRTRPKRWRVQIDRVLYEYSRLIKKD
jgi:hypothetical protein